MSETTPWLWEFTHCLGDRGIHIILSQDRVRNQKCKQNAVGLERKTWRCLLVGKEFKVGIRAFIYGTIIECQVGFMHYTMNT